MKTLMLASALAGASALTLPRAIAAHGVRADASSPQAVLDELNRAFAEFRTQNDQRIAALEAGRTDPVATERVETLTRTVGELQSSLDQLTLRIEAARLSGGMSGDPRLLTPESRAYSAAFNTFFRRGEGESGLNALAVQAAMTTGTDADGGYLVPFEMEQTIDRVLMTVSAVRDLATVMTISGGSYKKQLSLGGAGSGWVGETETRSETGTPSLVELEFTPGEIYAEPRASQQLLDDARVDLAQWLADEVSITFAEQEGAAFVTGTGVKKPRGIMDYDKIANASYAWGSLGFIVSGAAADFASSNPWQALVDVQQALKVGYRPNARWLMNRATVGKVRKFVDANGLPLWQPSAQVGQPSSLLGYPVSEDDNVADVGANAYPVAFGDFRRGYLIVDRIGVRVLRDPYTAKPYVKFYTTKRVGGGVQNFEAIKLLKIST
jgi:HK97 family phage major capsid protein